MAPTCISAQHVLFSLLLVWRFVGLSTCFVASNQGRIFKISPMSRGVSSSILVSASSKIEPPNNSQEKANETGNGTKKPSNAANSRSVVAFALYESLRKAKRGNQENPTIIAQRSLEQNSDFLALDTRDRAFAKLLLTTIERRRGQIDRVLNQFIPKPNKGKRDSDLLCQVTLRLGVAQLLFLDTPAYAALQETVQVLRMHPRIKIGRPQINFVNGVLRNIDRTGKEKALEGTCISDNVLPELVQEWKETYGDATTEQIIEAAMKQSPIFVTVNHDVNSSTEIKRQEEREKVRSAFSSATSSTKKDEKENLPQPHTDAEILPHGSILVPSQPLSRVSNWPGYMSGDWWVQDPSAALPALALYSTLTKDIASSTTTFDSMEDMHVVDLCSAPGGKTAQLCSMGFGKVTAVELSSRRAKVLRSNLDRLQMSDRCQVIVEDGRKWLPNRDSKDDTVAAVLLDAPCSATGVGSRRPDVLTKSICIEELLTVQRELAIHTVDNILNVGGIMVYATCSLRKAESEDQMHFLLSRASASQVETIPFEPGEIPGFDEAIDENGWLRVIPGKLANNLAYCDGFFVARIRRTG